MKTSTVQFVQLQRFLEQLGFADTRDENGWRFEHAASDTLFLFRPYRPREKVYEHDLFRVRLQLHSRGLIAEEVFGESLTKTPA